MKYMLKKIFLLLIALNYSGILLSQTINNCEKNVISNDSIIQLHKEYVALCEDSIIKYYRIGEFNKPVLFIEKAKGIGEKHFCDSNLFFVYRYETLGKIVRGLDPSAHFEKYFDFIGNFPKCNSKKYSK